jgi:hypothetical protein
MSTTIAVIVAILIWLAVSAAIPIDYSEEDDPWA